MLNITMPSIEDVLSALSKREFWVGVFLSGGVSVASCLLYQNMKIDNIKLQHALDIRKIERDQNLVLQEKALIEDRNSKLKSDLEILVSNNEKLLHREKTLMKGMSGYCYELKMAVRTLQKDHKLQHKYDINYEYRSILEKVLINIYSEAERCSRVLSPSA